ncbi:hypothetical protein MLD38_019733 [Melastoma candidum]|uniref:Uncharacterized protein n=1 Tax=Melastoma candidum TaxID=119954 RepID=A0ACB9QXX0_9MYRT|nr:hypothetical protein MLD38_019733 [Melastoma candidum]
MLITERIRYRGEPIVSLKGRTSLQPSPGKWVLNPGAVAAEKRSGDSAVRELTPFGEGVREAAPRLRELVAVVGSCVPGCLSPHLAGNRTGGRLHGKEGQQNRSEKKLGQNGINGEAGRSGSPSASSLNAGWLSVGLFPGRVGLGQLRLRRSEAERAWLPSWSVAAVRSRAGCPWRGERRGKGVTELRLTGRAWLRSYSIATVRSRAVCLAAYRAGGAVRVLLRAGRSGRDSCCCCGKVHWLIAELRGGPLSSFHRSERRRALVLCAECTAPRLHNAQWNKRSLGGLGWQTVMIMLPSISRIYARCGGLAPAELVAAPCLESEFGWHSQ